MEAPAQLKTAMADDSNTPTTALIAWAAFGETLTGLALIGMGLTVFGVWLARK